MKSLGLSRCVSTLGVAIAFLAGCDGSQPPVGAFGVTQRNPAVRSPEKTRSKTFAYTGGQQTFEIPAGVTHVTILASGASGGAGYGSGFSGPGGLLTATIPVTPGETLTVVVGGAGTANTAGYNGGGEAGDSGSCRPTCGGGGGGASDVRRGGNSLNDRVVVSGGGGGQACCRHSAQGGAGGGLVGGKGANGAFEGSRHGGVSGGKGGRGGHPNHGGAGGAGGTGYYYYCPGTTGANGTLGVGGQGGISCNAHAGGGGGGGYYGGGGGGGGCGYCGQSGSFYTSGGGGGGGGSYTEAFATNISDRRGRAVPGNGQVIISWQK